MIEMRWFCFVGSGGVGGLRSLDYRTSDDTGNGKGT